MSAAIGALAPLTSRGAEVEPRSWSVITGRTLGQGAGAFQTQWGWPGISATALAGVGPHLDLGGTLTFNYGFEGVVKYVIGGFKLQALLRGTLLDSGKANLGIYFAPGFLVYSEAAGVTLPFGVTLGIRASDKLNVALAVELPMLLVGAEEGGVLAVPVLFGGGLEYFVERNLAVTFSARAGPIFYPGGSDLDLQALIGVAVKF